MKFYSDESVRNSFFVAISIVGKEFYFLKKCDKRKFCGYKSVGINFF